MTPLLALLALSILNPGLSIALAQTTAFTYQGRLDDGNAPANGIYDLQFGLYDAAVGGTQHGPALTNAATAASNGLFTVVLNFGYDVFTGDARWLEIAVRTNGPGGFNTLSPRQSILPTPYAMHAEFAGNIQPDANVSFSGPVTFSYPLGQPFYLAPGVTNLVQNLNAQYLAGRDAGQFWWLGGNSGQLPESYVLGTLDPQPLGFTVNGERALRLEPHPTSPNLIGGYSGNIVSNGFAGAVIAGGGQANNANRVGANFASVLGGYNNTAAGFGSTAAGVGNAARGNNSTAIGIGNTSSGVSSMVLGVASVASGDYSTAMGIRAQASHAGSFVWADLTEVDFPSTANNQFSVRAYGGARFVTSGAGLTVDGQPVFTGVNGSTLTALNASQLTSGTVPDLRLAANVARTNQVWMLGGNFGTTPGTHFIGTRDNNPLELKVNNQRGFLLHPGLFSTIHVIAGSSLNRIEGDVIGATIAGGGGLDDLTLADNGNRVTGDYGTVGGGRQNLAAVAEATVAGGRANTASAFNATVSGGYANQASGNSATIPGGMANLAAGHFSLAAGRRAKANHTGAFVWADSNDSDFSSTANNQFLIRATGGTYIQGGDRWDVNNTEGDFRVGSDTHRFKIGVAQTGGGAGDVWMRAQGGTARLFLKTPGGTTIYSNEGQTTGVSLTSGNGAWTTVSDRNAKENFAPVNPQDVLEKVAALPLSSWNYKSQDAGIRHLGPMAQDFRTAFGLGECDTGITTVDADGVALAAIQGLNQKLADEIKRRDAENAALKARLERLEHIISQQLSKNTQ